MLMVLCLYWNIKIDLDMNMLTQYANSIAFTANCPPNYAQEMVYIFSKNVNFLDSKSLSFLN